MNKLIKIYGHPHLRKDRNGVVHNTDQKSLEDTRLKKDVSLLKNELKEIKALLKSVLEKNSNGDY